ncbi:hypothetical protein N7492_003862 [Penicillium capsulatum]|uniref:Xylanolytic transcriptional activator regulatory domain-containing protein n=1 Tax=Penicillium capsulatum TaxID=69766 RepID=A0A9W9LXV2_9EURO|nr:hypothetical protein N7492_003862 [Penicillium capsulatum]
MRHLPDAWVTVLDIEFAREDLFVEDSWNMFFSSYRLEGGSHKSLVPSLDDSSLRQIAASRIISCLENVHTKFPQASDDYQTVHTQELFREENVREFTEAYFEHTVRPRSRVVLKTTFNLESISTPLLLSILIMGASCGNADNAKSQAVKYADMAEFAVFEDSRFLQLVYRKGDLEQDPLTKGDLEIIQAALLVILIQIASPNAESRRRIRIQRYSALVCVARATSLTQIKNRWHDSNSPLRHAEFLMNESCIRIMASISMIDTHFIMFFNQPPALIPQELNYDLPAEEDGIDISDNVTWEAWARNERKYQRPPIVSQFLQELMSDDWSGPEDPRFDNLNVFALFIIISGRFSRSAPIYFLLADDDKRSIESYLEFGPVFVTCLVRSVKWIGVFKGGWLNGNDCNRGSTKMKSIEQDS